MSEGEQVISALWSQGTLIDLGIGRSTFQKKLNETDLGLKGMNKGAYHFGHKKLLPENALENLISIESEARSFLDTRSLKFPLSGARFVYYRTLKEVLDRLESCRSRWDAEVQTLIANFESLKQTQLQVLDDEATKIMSMKLSEIPLPGPEDDLVAKAKMLKFKEDKKAEWEAWLSTQKHSHRLLYPLPEELPGMFRFGWRMFKISAVDGLSAMSAMEKDTLLEAQDKLKAEMKQWVKESATALHRSLGEAAANAKQLLEKQGKLNPKNLKPLFDSFEVFKAVDFTGSSDFHNKVEAIRQKFVIQRSGGGLDLEKTAAGINDTATGMQEFKEMLNTLSDLAVSGVAEAAGLSSLSKVGEFRRIIEM